MGDDEIQERPGPAPPESAPARVVSLRDLAGRGNTDGTAAANNQSRLGVATGPMQIAMGFITVAQHLSATLYYCTLAICERLDRRDAPALLQEMEKNVQEQNGKLN